MFVFSNRIHEGLDGIQPAFVGCFAPAVQEGFGLVDVLELPERLEFVFQQPFPDGTDVDLARVAAVVLDSEPLVYARFLFPEAVDGFAAFACSNRDDTGSFGFVDDGGVRSPFAVRFRRCRSIGDF